MPQVIVVPETEEYELHVSHQNVAWITKKLGLPNLDGRDARYLAPLWIKEPLGVNRLYHILDVKDDDQSTEIKLGNSFVLAPPSNAAGQRRRFEYHDLSEFGLLEIRPGLLFPNK